MKPRRKKQPYPYQPLTYWLQQTTIKQIAQRLNQDWHTIYRKLERAKQTGFNEPDADRIATAIGTHPYTIWGSLWNQNFRPD